MIVDIVDIKKQVKEGTIIPFISGESVYLSNECGEIVCIGNIFEMKEKGGGKI